MRSKLGRTGDINVLAQFAAVDVRCGAMSVIGLAVTGLAALGIYMVSVTGGRQRSV